MEAETARLASRHRNKEQVSAFQDILAREEVTGRHDIDGLSGLDFELHQLIALASGNLVYPLLINSFKPVYTTMTSTFFSDAAVVPEVHSFHKKLVAAIESKDEKKAARIMTELLAHGEQHLVRLI